MSLVFAPQPPADHAAWRSRVEERLVRQRAAVSPQTSDQMRVSIATMMNRWFPDQNPGPGTLVFAVRSDDDVVGTCCVLADDASAEAFVLDLEVDVTREEEVDARSLREALIAEVRRLGSETLVIRRAPTDDVATAVIHVGPHELAGSRMIASLREPLVDDGRVLPVELRAMTPEEYLRFEDDQVTTYAESRVRAGVVTFERSLEQARAQIQALLAHGVATPHHFLLRAYAEGENVGNLWLFEETTDAGKRGYVYNVDVDKSVRGRGFGRGIMVAGERLLREIGVEFVELNVFGFNDVARALYLSLGYVVSDEMFSLPLGA